MEEISLRELIEILLKRKKIIMGTTLLAVLASAIVSFFILEPVYETRMVLMASNFSDKLQPNQLKGEGIDNILSNLSQYPSMTMETYKQQVKAPKVMRETIEELGLEDKYDIESLAKSITLETIKDTNLLNIKMQAKDPELAAEIVNTVGRKFVAFVSDKAKEQATTTSQYIKTQIDAEKEQLDKALVELKDFLGQPQGVQELTQEVEAKLMLVTEYKTSLFQEELQREVLQQSINKVKNELKAEKPLIVTEKSILEDSLLSNLAKEKTGENIGDIASIRMNNEEVNPVYIALKEKEAEIAVELTQAETKVQMLKTQIQSIQQEVEDLQIKLAERQHEGRLIDQKVQIAQNTYDAFTRKHEELRVTESSQVGESNMIIVSKAYPTTNPVAPRKALNVAIAGVLGIMLGVFAAFSIEYWQASGEEKKNIPSTN
ncbi:hypothetical protein KQI88_08860 [Alkaliphilus sp. MSJ-5]|uniref:Lipopolysaccharide biosynthesis protein n=1 Tax=Alkaliphilus flagellatus TaxID=2841507 RepID=A0ABS6G309_9FIRM|nr:Wzz/FepE/Etk N-terminal domain-containing protein [Alkaliphilus flagellatus]MBU5676526.1 hypothetical protein [Alkaliphilus flagellatus]